MRSPLFFYIPCAFPGNQIMTPSLNVPVPFLLDFGGSTVEDVVIFTVSMLVAVTVSAESQGFAATSLGDAQAGTTKRFHFNSFLHLDILGTLCFYIAGFGWAKEVEVEAANFKHPKFYLMLSRLAGPLGNFVMANIAASVVAIFGGFGIEDKVFTALIVVNMTMAVYGLICIAPLPGASILSFVLPENRVVRTAARYFRLAGPFLLIAWFLLARFTGHDPIGEVLHPLVRTLSFFLSNFMLK
jgi:Zn-dependent protease